MQPSDERPPLLRTNYILIDYENVQVKSLDRLQDEQFKVLIFLGPTNTKLPVDLVLSVQRLGDRAQYILLEAPGPNALDFHLAYYMGVLSSSDPTAYFHIISKDTGFDPLIQHLKSRKIFSARSVSIDDIPCFKAASLLANNGSNTLSAAPTPESLFRPVLEHLVKSKASKPRTIKTLKSTIQAKCGKELPTELIDKVFALLLKKAYVLVDGTKVSYALPTTPAQQDST